MADSSLQVENLKQSKTMEYNYESKPNIKFKKRLRCSYSEGTDPLNVSEMLQNNIEMELNKNLEYERIQTLYEKLQNLIMDMCENDPKFSLLEGLQDLFHSFCNSQTKLQELEMFILTNQPNLDTNKDLDDITESLQSLKDLLSTNDCLNMEIVENLHNKKTKDHTQNLQKSVFLLWQTLYEKNKEIREKSHMLAYKDELITRKNMLLIQTFEYLMSYCNKDHKELLAILKQQKLKIIEEFWRMELSIEYNQFKLSPRETLTNTDVNKSDNVIYNYEHEKLDTDNFGNSNLVDLAKKRKLLCNKITQLERNNSTVSETVGLLQIEINNLKHLNMNLTSDKHSLQDEVKNQTNYIETLKREKNLLCDKISMLKLDVELKEKYLAEQICLNNELATKNNNLCNKILQEEVTNGDLKSLKNLLKHKISQQEQVISKLIEKNIKLRHDIMLHRFDEECPLIDEELKKYNKRGASNLNLNHNESRKNKVNIYGTTSEASQFKKRRHTAHDCSRNLDIEDTSVATTSNNCQI